MSFVEGLTLKKTLESVEKRIKVLEESKHKSWTRKEIELLYKRRLMLKKKIMESEIRNKSET